MNYLVSLPNLSSLTWPIVLDYAIKVVIIIVAIIILTMIIKFSLKGLEKILDKRQVRNPFIGFIISVTKIVSYVILILIVLGFFNINTAPLLAVLGTFGLALGLALKDHMSNLASGILIILNKQFKIGDYIGCANTAGSVEIIELFSTKLITFDNKAVFVPNSLFTQNAVINYSREDMRRVDVAIGVSYSAKVENVKSIIESIVTENEKILSVPSHFVGLTDFGDSSVNFTVRVWTKTEDYWDTYFYINESIKREFDKQKIEIPFPQMDVHMKKE
ncbi:MAG: mechanosensitive ion channel family protein [Clostridiales bacterium]|nr:mechanosensitive ion channel family protein [Clostridiales bacterium]